MHNGNLISVFTNLWSKDKLGPLYLIRPPLLQPTKSLQDWSRELECAILMESYSIDRERASEKAQNGHPDILHIYKEKVDKNYKVDNAGISELFKMQAHQSVELKRRMVFIHDGELIKETLSNKLLKILEDPRKDTSIFILNNTQKEMLQTIESRAIKLSLLPEKTNGLKFLDKMDFNESLNQKFSEDHPDFVDSILNESLSNAVEYLQKNEQCFESYCSLLFEYAKSQSSKLSFKVKLLYCIKKDRELRTFYTHTGARYYSWVQLAQHTR